MTYAWPGGQTHRSRCRGTTKRGERCKVRGYPWGMGEFNYWCPLHVDQMKPNP